MRPRSRATNTTERIPPRTDFQIQLVGGKGGVGKTTCAAALGFAAAARGVRVLVVSTDPAPSLADAFGVALAATPRVVPGRRGRLHAVQVDARGAVSRWLRRRRPTLEAIALRGTWLDSNDVAMLLGLSLPGVDEVAGLLEVVRFGRSGRYDSIVVDTAPTGHTLRMLAMPETLGAVADVFDRMQAKHRAIVEALHGIWRGDDADELIQELMDDARELSEVLRDPGRTLISWVTLPEKMAVEETVDAVTWLADHGLPLERIVANRVTPPPPGRCAWCDARRTLEHKAILELRRALRSPSRRGGAAPPQFTTVHARETEPVGLRALSALGSELETLAEEELPARAGRRSGPAARANGFRAAQRKEAALLDTGEVRLVMFGGKGGVGKTTCAAAVALATADTCPGRRLLLLSTDPAHSLADAFGLAASDVPRPMPGGPMNLDVRELDAAEAFRRVRLQYATAIDALFDRLTRGSAFDAIHDRRVMHGLIDLAPPGLDELAATLDATEALTNGNSSLQYDTIVMDTAPSGHALRLLEMPALVRDWTKALMSILLKYQPVAGLGDLGAMLLHLSQGLGRLRALLRNPSATQFILVTRAAALPRAESLRLVRRLGRLQVHVPAVIVNAVGRGDCVRCRREAEGEWREITRIGRNLAGRRIVLAPAEVPPPHGRTSLIRWRRAWRPAGRAT